MPLRLKRTLARLGLKQADLARLLEVSQRTVSLWATGAVPVPGPVVAYLRVLEAAGPEVREREIKGLVLAGGGLEEGLYRLTYAASGKSERPGDDALAVLRSGSILGSDRGGCVFTGSYSFDAESGMSTVHLRLAVPAGGELVNGIVAGPDGAMLEISGAFRRAAPLASTVVDVGGRPVEVRLTYLGPLPG